MTSPQGEAVPRIALRTTIAVAAPGASEAVTSPQGEAAVTGTAIGMNAHSMGVKA